jgi:hypothetical protein
MAEVFKFKCLLIQKVVVQKKYCVFMLIDNGQT